MPASVNNLVSSLYKSYGWDAKQNAPEKTEEESISETKEEGFSAAYKTDLSTKDKAYQQTAATDADKQKEIGPGANPLSGLPDPSKTDSTEADLIKMKKSYIEMLMKSVRMMSPRDYTGKSWSALLDCIKQAVAILGKAGVTSGELTKAEQLLHKGLGGLRRVDPPKKENANLRKDIPIKNFLNGEDEAAAEAKSGKTADAASIAGAVATPSSDPVAAFLNAQGSLVTSINMKI